MSYCVWSSTLQSASNPCLPDHSQLSLFSSSNSDWFEWESKSISCSEERTGWLWLVYIILFWFLRVEYLTMNTSTVPCLNAIVSFSTSYLLLREGNLILHRYTHFWRYVIAYACFSAGMISNYSKYLSAYCFLGVYISLMKNLKIDGEEKTTCWQV